MKKIAVYGNPRQNKFLDDIALFLKTLEQKDIDIYVYDEFADYLRHEGIEGNWTRATCMPDDVWRLVSVGGDGTFLHAAKWARRSHVPILGINTGHLGFLANYSFGDTDELVRVIIEGDGTIEPRMVLKIESDDMPADFWPYALNEVAIIKSDTASMLTARTWINSRYLADYLADGLIIATPTGSTAYNLSVGGPILEPTVENIVISPVAPHSLTMRPLVVSGNAAVDVLAFSKAHKCRISLDGRTFPLKCNAGDFPDAKPIRITKADFIVNILRRPDSNFADILRNKLLWGKR